MENTNQETTQAGNEVMKAVGELKSSTEKLKKETQASCKTNPEEVGTWITAIGKALLSILK